MKQNKNHIRLTILGCGTSTGVPRPDGFWGNCNPNCSKNYRRRAALLIQKIGEDNRETTILIDSGPDIRHQLFDAKVKNIDAIFYTHAHADHVHGIDDLRYYSSVHRQKNKKLMVYAHPATITYLHQNFRYCFFSPDETFYPSLFETQAIGGGDKIEIHGEGGTITIEPILQIHGKIYSLGFRVGPIAYCVDLNEFTSQALNQLQNLDLLIIESLHNNPHVSHLSLPQALEWIEYFKPKEALITAMSGALDYETLRQSLPSNVKPSYDGLTVDVLF